MDIKYELKKRMKQEEDTYNALGAEIKQHRLAQDRTLQSIADKNCSVSYLCKIERNQIKPSPKYLKEICRKVGISEEKTGYLLGSRDLLLEAIKLFYFNDIEKENEHLAKLAGLDNHRVELIRFIFAMSRHDLKEGKRCKDKLEKLTGSLATLDLMVFVSFYGIYLYYTEDYINAADYLKLGITNSIPVEYLLPIQLMYLFEVALICHSPNTTLYYKNLEEEIYHYGSNLELERFHYEMAYYYLQEENYTEYEKILKKIHNKLALNTLDYIYNQSLENNKEYKPEELDALGKCYYKIYNHTQDAKRYILNSNLRNEIKNQLLYRYLKTKSLEKSYDYLLKEAFPIAINNNLYYDADYYLEEMIMSIHRPNRYKLFLDMFLELRQVKNLVKQI